VYLYTSFIELLVSTELVVELVEASTLSTSVYLYLVVNRHFDLLSVSKVMYLENLKPPSINAI